MAGSLTSVSFNFGRCRLCLFKNLFSDQFKLKNIRKCQSKTTVAPISAKSHPVDFGLFFDIDGVITRGRTLLPHSKSAFKLLTDDRGQFLVPSIFVTNAGNTVRHTKAKQLSNYLDIHIDEDQVIMSHSPLRMFTQFLDKHVLVAGQGPVDTIAHVLGFTNVTTMDTFRQCFPLLDTVDHQRRKAAPCAFEKFYPKIEAVVLFGEPVRWETTLQLIIDVLISNGRPSEVVTSIPYPHLPVLACNMDLVWMSEAPMPRFGHGCFMHCLESLYKKITGYELKYTALLGKPSEITYHYAERVLQFEARKMKLPRIRRMYCIGDNPDTDIYGANLFNRDIQKKREKMAMRRQMAAQASGAMSMTSSTVTSTTESDSHLLDAELSIELLNSERTLTNIDVCESILVCTGVYSAGDGRRVRSSHSHRDFVMDVDLCQPSLTTVHNVEEAVRAVFDKEGIDHLLLR